MRMSVCVTAVVLAGVGGWAVGSAQPPTPPPAEPDPAQVLRAAQAYARVVAGADSGPAYVDALEYALQGAGEQQRRRQRPPAAPPAADAVAPPAVPDLMPATRGKVVSPFAQTRARTTPVAAVPPSIRNNKGWRENREMYFTKLVDKILPRLQIHGGSFANPKEIPDCVAVGSATEFCCSGTLIGPNVVLTAGHCDKRGCVDRVFVGTNSNAVHTGRLVAVKKTIPHPEYDDATFANDLAVLILKERLDVPPAPFADPGDLAAARFVRVVGFGFTENREFGHQAKVNVFIAPNACGTPLDPGPFGCDGEKQFVAGGNGHDSCNGDSGGGAYVLKGNTWHLAGSTSRPSVLACGDGGVYVRLDKYRDWIVQTAADNGGEIPK